MSEVSRRGLVCAAPCGLVAGLLVVESAPAVAAGAAVIATSRVPVGGGVVVSRRNVVVTQPTRGRFRVFSASCTHEGCGVTRVAGGRIGCPCHGSQFSLADGSAVRGPATRPLTTRRFRVKRGKIYLT